VLTVITPTAITQKAAVPATVFVALSASPE
jgi:hypothetical protein